MGARRSLYRTLQVDPAAEDIVIRAAYRALMKEHHPDRGGDTILAQQLNAAYATLADPLSRRTYDRFLRHRTADRAAAGAEAAPRLTSARSLAEELGEEFYRRFTPDFPAGLSRIFDFAGILAGSPRHRIWIKQVWRGDATDARAFRSGVEAARLSRPIWGFGSDLFVAALPAITPEFRWLLRGPTGPIPRVSWAVVLLDLGARELHATGRSAELPAFAPLAETVRSGPGSASAAGPPNT